MMFTLHLVYSTKKIIVKNEKKNYKNLIKSDPVFTNKSSPLRFTSQRRLFPNSMDGAMPPICPAKIRAEPEMIMKNLYCIIP